MMQTDAIIIGTGPCGLFQAFQLGLQGIRCHLIDALPLAGGQCAELYPDKPIYDIPGIPVIEAQHLRDQLEQQIKPFEPVFHFSQTVETIDNTQPGQNGLARLRVETSTGISITANSVIVATGAGAFTPVKLRVEGIERFEDQQLFYNDMDTTLLRQKRVVVTGDTPAAINTAIEVAATASNTVLLHRKRRLPIEPAQQLLIDQLRQDNKLQLVNGKILGSNGEPSLQALQIQLQSKEHSSLPVDLLLARLGNSPKTNDLQKWGLESERNLVKVNAGDFSASRDGVYAIGDINSYAGKRKLILCGFHEATLAAFAIAKKMRPAEPSHTLYTTTSTVLQQRLGLT